jgi:hypothetical protein
MTVEQKLDTDSSLIALHRGTGFLHAAAEITPAYGSKSAVVQKVQRELVYLEPNVVVVYDRVQTKAGSQVWQLVSPASPSINGATASATASGHTMTVQKIAGGTMAVTSMKSVDATDFTGGFRLDETMPAGDNHYLHVISIDGAASAVTAGTDGVTLTVGGKAVVVQFTRDGVGGSVSIDGQSTTLAAGVDKLPE